MENGLARISSNSLRNLECISSALGLFSFIKWSHTHSSLPVIWTCLPQPSPGGSDTWEIWKAWLPVKTEAKNSLSTSDFSISVFSILPSRLPWPLFSAFLFQAMYIENSFLVFFTSLAKSHSICALVFLIHLYTSNLYLCTLPRSPVLLPLAMYFFLIPQFEKQILAQPYQFVSLSLWFSKHLSSKSCQLWSAFLSLISQGITFTNYLNSWKFAFPKFSIQSIFLARPMFLGIMNSTQAWSLHSSQSRILTTLMSSSLALVQAQ